MKDVAQRGNWRKDEECKGDRPVAPTPWDTRDAKGIQCRFSLFEKEGQDAKCIQLILSI
jgi:hypothetical protein